MQYYPQIDQHRAAVSRILRDGGTPLFLGDRSILENRYHELQASMQRHWGRSIVGYSFKTNYLAAESGVFQALGAWAEVVSGREYELAKRLGYPGSQIILNGPHKPDSLLHTASRDGALINVNDQNELERLIGIARVEDLTPRVGLRVSSNLPRLGHSRFGFSLENGEAITALRTLADAPALQLQGLHTHAYGDTDDPEIYRVAADRMGRFAQQHIPGYEQKIRFVDVGGGYPAHSPKPKSRTEWAPREIDAYVATVADALRSYFDSSDKGPCLVMEPGRYLTCDGILLATQVLHTLERDGRQVINCDGSISMIPLTHYCPQIIKAYSPTIEPKTKDEVPTTIYGSTCRENDLLYQGDFPRVARGDYLLHFAAGAYNSSLSPDFIFASPRMELF
jgi:diaminopimelate decarboxylase